MLIVVAIAAGLALSARVAAAIASDAAVPASSRLEFSLEWGFGLPLLILIVACVYGVGARAAPRRAGRHPTRR